MIKHYDYKYISDTLGDAQITGSFMLGSLSDMLTDITSNEIPSSDTQKQAMTSSIIDCYQIILRNHVYVSKEMSNTVRALQNLVIKHFGSVDDYLSSNKIQVSQDFANLSSIIGYPISMENIE